MTRAGNVDASPESRTWSVDGDGDGSMAPADCAPDNPAVHPAAADQPDLAFADTNCDGIDGREAGAVFVSPTGSDANSGLTRSQPKATLSAATSTALSVARTQIYVASGTYSSLAAQTGISLYGGYDPVTWQRSSALGASTVISGSPQAVFADGDTGVLLQLLALNGSAGPGLGQSAYGLRAVNGSSVTAPSRRGDRRCGNERRERHERRGRLARQSG